MLKVKFLRVILKIFRKLYLSTYELILKSEKILSSETRLTRIIESTKYNMHEESNEQFYLEEYFLQLEKFLPNEYNSQIIKVLDLGCGQGRFISGILNLFPNAKITGIDLSPEVIKENKVKFNLVKGVEFIEGNFSVHLDSLADNHFDVIILTEVAFFYPEWKFDFPKILLKLKTGGQLIFSTRSSYFNALSQIAQGNMKDAERICETKQGHLTIEDPMQFSWNSSDELINFFRHHSMKIDHVSGIGVCSGIPGDPLARIVIPSNLYIHDRKILSKIENKFATLIPDAGRYLLFIATKEESIKL